MLGDVSRLLQVALSLLGQHCEKDIGIHRLHLLIEEIDELVDGLAGGYEIVVLDALADISYIIEGTAVIYDLPLAAAFWEVHRSNMTKNKNAKFKTKDKGKGPTYSSPNLAKVLEEYRDAKPGT